MSTPEKGEDSFEMNPKYCNVIKVKNKALLKIELLFLANPVPLLGRTTVCLSLLPLITVPTKAINIFFVQTIPNTPSKFALSNWSYQSNLRAIFVTVFYSHNTAKYCMDYFLTRQ